MASSSSSSSPAVSEDELYDPLADARDARGAAGGGGFSDARLACPGCFAPVAERTQAHARFPGQWRALEARGVRARAEAQLREEGGEIFTPVACIQCGHELAVQDEEGVYHFFDCIPSDP